MCKVYSALQAPLTRCLPSLRDEALPAILAQRAAGGRDQLLGGRVRKQRAPLAVQQPCNAVTDRE